MFHVRTIPLIVASAVHAAAHAVRAQSTLSSRALCSVALGRPRSRVACCDGGVDAGNGIQQQLAEKLDLDREEREADQPQKSLVFEAYERERRRNVVLALGSSAVAAGLYAFQRLNPADPVKLLKLMEADSLPLPAALSNGRATLVEFYAPWCDSCKLMARSMRRLERAYGDRLNFVVLDGDNPLNAKLVRLFQVDGIPHFALVSPEGTLLETLVGFVPASVMERKIASLADRPMPARS